MKKDLNVEIKDIKGETVKDKDKKPMIVSDICVDALLGHYQDEKTISGQEKFKRFQLAIKVQNGEQDYSIEEIAKIKDLVGKGFTSLFVGRVYEVLEGDKK